MIKSFTVKAASIWRKTALCIKTFFKDCFVELKKKLFLTVFFNFQLKYKQKMFFVSTNIAKKIRYGRSAKLFFSYKLFFFLMKVTHFYIANMFIFYIFTFTG